MTLRVQGVTYDIGQSDITYTFTVRVGEQEWFVHKVYKDFVALNEKLVARYGSNAVPRLTGAVYIRPLSTSTGDKRLPKLEDFLSEILSTWKQKFKKPQFFEIESKKIGKILLEVTMAQFFEFQDNYEEEEEDEEEEEQQEEQQQKEEQEQNKNQSESSEIQQQQQQQQTETRAERSGSHFKNNNSSAAAAAASASSTSISSDQDTTPRIPSATTSSNLNNNNNTSQQQIQQKPPPPPKQKQQQQEDDGFDVVDEVNDVFDSAHVLAQCRNMSSEVDVIVKDYVIHPKDYIEYHFFITFCGFSWTVTKRFSEFAAYHNALVAELQGTEFSSFVPPIDDVMFPAWRKCDPDVAEIRSVFMTNYFKIIAPMMDEWFDIGYLTHFRIRRRSDEEEVDSLERYASAAKFIKVSINRMLFDFFAFQGQVNEFNATSAEKVAKENEKYLPQQMQKNLEAVRKEEERVQKERNLSYRRSFMERLSEMEFSDMMRILSQFDDDRHALGLLEFFVKNGYYYPGKTRFERLQELEAQAVITAKRRSATMCVMNQQQQQQQQSQGNLTKNMSTGSVSSSVSASSIPSISAPSSGTFSPTISASKKAAVKIF